MGACPGGARPLKFSSRFVLPRSPNKRGITHLQSYNAAFIIDGGSFNMRLYNADADEAAAELFVELRPGIGIPQYVDAVPYPRQSLRRTIWLTSYVTSSLNLFRLHPTLHLCRTL